MSELLIEILMEEVPARFQKTAENDFNALLSSGLKDLGLAFDSADCYSTPRRLIAHIQGLPKVQESRTEERRGPRVGAPEQALAGFLKSADCSKDDLEVRATEKGEFYFASKHIEGAAVTDLIPGILQKTMEKMQWPKPMRWGASTFEWVRPIKHIMCLFNGNLVSGGVDFGGVHYPFTDKTVGHRFLASESFKIGSFDQYKKSLENAFVLISRDERRERITRAMAALAEAKSITIKQDPALLEEVIGLVEYPVPMIGAVDARFMRLPEEVIITPMRVHQRYFATENADDGSLAPYYILVANLPGSDGGDEIVSGNSRVLVARLSDAEFFWEQDCKHKLETYLANLDKVIYHVKLGSIGDKAKRLEQLVVKLGVDGKDTELKRAAKLAKADLVTQMVGEFSELQGIMGGYYAGLSGESEAVAQAISDHYRPQGPNDSCPTAPVSVAVALADKLDMLVGFFGVGVKPTGSGDQFGLRRAALGVIRLILESNLRVSMKNLLKQAAEVYRAAGIKLDPATEDDLFAFILERLRIYLGNEDIRPDCARAIFALGQEDDLVRLVARIRALQNFVQGEDGTNLLAAFKRARNIVAKEEKKDKAAYDCSVKADLFAVDAESGLYEALVKVSEQSQTAVAREQFEEAMSALATLRTPLDAFFDQVIVNGDDAAVRVNRLKLLVSLRQSMEVLADFSQFEG